MASLAPALRKKLEDAVKEARDVAEAGARAALEQLAVHAAEPFSHLSPEDRELRNRLRARARQLGDGRDTRTGAHQIDHLVVECAYEHWHRMLFARFLAENGVLMANSEALGIENTPVTLEECEELAADEGAANGWELAGRYASKMLPQIFRPDAPVLAVHLPPERQRRLEQILAELAAETFKASDALGWVYQFWQAKKKDEVNASGVKIGADELPAVTQLFTEPYMVEFLLHNTLGAWWAGKVLAEQPELARTAKSEDELRQACALPGYRWTYLRFVREDDKWQPAAGNFDEWPRAASGLRVLDPCCGSGHFLVTAFDILVELRRHQEGLERSEAGAAVLSDNLYGLELDERCTQIAAFALALRAWSDGGYRALPDLHIACSGTAPRAPLSDWLGLTQDAPQLRTGMERLHACFGDAPVLGSLIDPREVGLRGSQRELGVAQFESLEPLLKVTLDQESRFDGQKEMAVAAKGIAAAALLLTRRYSLVVTNVPYLGRAQMATTLSRYCDDHLSAGSSNLATAFIERYLLGAATDKGGAVALVAPQNWLVQDSYADLRHQLLTSTSFDLASPLGVGAFSTISGHVVNVLLFIATQRPPSGGCRLSVVDAESASSPDDKDLALASGPVRRVDQAQQAIGAKKRFSLLDRPQELPLLRHAFSTEGMSTGDADRFQRCFWELGRVDARWELLQDAPGSDEDDEGTSSVVLWEGGQGDLARFEGARIRGHSAWGKQGVLLGRIGTLRTSLYRGRLFSKSCVVLTPRDVNDLAALYCYASSDAFSAAVSQLNKKVSVPTKVFEDIPFDTSFWRTEAAMQFPNGVQATKGRRSDQWGFRGHPVGADHPLQVAVARLLGFIWPEQDETSGEPIDDDGIVCLPSLRGEEPAARRLTSLLEILYADDWNAGTRDELLAAVGADGKGLAWWLQNKFFEQHCQLYQHRPFIWHIWDGIKKDGFGALVNYHKLDRKLLETLTYTYLGDWIRRQQDDAGRNVDGAAERLDAARRLQQSLELILEGEKPHDIFVRWKPLHEQPIGWEPDLNDGVRVNIRPFMSVPDVDKKGAGVLRYKPNIHWKKDRGTDPDDAPWFELGPSYGEPKGARINDHHLSLAEKRAARERAGGR